MSIDTKDRILKDIKRINRSSDLKENGIYVWFNEENIFNSRALIIGPPDTPYHNGYYLFDINFPKDYPQTPPKVLFCTLDKSWRANPNLYKDGKVCLSIIGTWQGPQWTPCLSLSTVLLSIQSMVLGGGNGHPIQNEPGWEQETGKKSKDYNTLLRYHNLRVAVLKMIEDTPVGFEYFRTIMIDHFMENRFTFLKYLDSIKKLDNKSIYSSMFSMGYKININSIKVIMDRIYDKYIDLYNKKCENFQKNMNNSDVSYSNSEQSNSGESKSEQSNPENSKNDITNIATSIIKAKSKRQCPKYAAKLYDIGVEQLGMNGTDMYIVKLGNTGKKRWVKKD